MVNQYWRTVSDINHERYLSCPLHKCENYKLQNSNHISLGLLNQNIWTSLYSIKLFFVCFTKRLFLRFHSISHWIYARSWRFRSAKTKWSTHTKVLSTKLLNHGKRRYKFSNRYQRHLMWRWSDMKRDPKMFTEYINRHGTVACWHGISRKHDSLKQRCIVFCKLYSIAFLTVVSEH